MASATRSRVAGGVSGCRNCEGDVGGGGDGWIASAVPGDGGGALGGLGANSGETGLRSSA